MTIPNILTVFRIVLVPIYLYLFYSSGKERLVYAGTAFILAGITDVLDGHIARRYDQATDVGAVLDPLADKLMTFAVLISFTMAELIPHWILLIIGLKEIVMILGGLILYFAKENQVLPSNRFGKAATIFFYASILSVILRMRPTVVRILFLAMVILNIIAFLNYLIIYLYMREQNRSTG
ncbi:MAG: CDP-diacylglycerol--glycerol-3-phosphate 3-phosphatidyltransferase [Tissierellia bacterium]|nr:CDP-diacylglycerol--glycerol-3-phosphate 3-phosphatidyltransferase [Tissierellia bacterium]